MRLDGAAPRRKVQASSAAARRRSLSPFCRFCFYYLFFPSKRKEKPSPAQTAGEEACHCAGLRRGNPSFFGERNTEIRRAEKNQTKTTKKPGRGLSLSGLVKAARIPVLFWPTVTYFLFVFK